MGEQRRGTVPGPYQCSAVGPEPTRGTVALRRKDFAGFRRRLKTRFRRDVLDKANAKPAPAAPATPTASAG